MRLADRDRRLKEGCLAHVDSGARPRARPHAPTATGTAARRCGQDGDHAQCYKDCYELFQGVCFSCYLYVDWLCRSLFYGSL